MDWVLRAFFIFHTLLLTLLFIYGLNILYLALRARQLRAPDPPPPPMNDFPFVTVQIPVYNERYVILRTLEHVCALDYPRDRLEIQVLDDSTDETSQMIAAYLHHQQNSGLHIVHLRRPNRSGYKAGALALGFAQARGDFFAVFDADFAPPPDFLKKTVPYFSDPRLGFLQTRWGHLNENYSLFTRLQGLSIDGHFIVEQFVRQRSGFLMNFNGTGGVWRREAIADAGGWSAQTLTEDLDLSYRALLRGWKPMYLRDVVTPGELPITANAFRRQQYRWARGSWECALRLLPQVWRAPLTRWQKIQATLHLSGYTIHLLMVLLAMLYPPLLILTVKDPTFLLILVVISCFNITAAAPTIYYALAQHEKGVNWRQRLPLILGLNLLGTGIMVNNTVALLQALRGKPAVFQRTPKYGVAGRRAEQAEKWSQKAYRLTISPVALLEFAFLLYNLNTLRMAWEAQNIAIFFYAGIFSGGLAFMLGLTAWQAMQVAVANLTALATSARPAVKIRSLRRLGFK